MMTDLMNLGKEDLQRKDLMNLVGLEMVQIVSCVCMMLEMAFEEEEEEMVSEKDEEMYFHDAGDDF